MQKKNGSTAQGGESDVTYLPAAHLGSPRVIDSRNIIAPKMQTVVATPVTPTPPVPTEVVSKKDNYYFPVATVFLIFLLLKSLGKI